MRHLNREEKNTAQINIIKEEQWLQYYKQLWNDDAIDNIENEQDNHNYEVGGTDPITKDKLECASNASKNRKATGMDNINMELLKYGRISLTLQLLHFINMYCIKCEIPNEWTIAIVKPLFKKGDRSDCSKYTGISLLMAGYKVYTRVIAGRLNPIIDATTAESQNGFRKGRSCTDSFFTLKMLVDKRHKYNLETHIAFIDYEKAFDRVNRQKLWEILPRKGTPMHTVQVIKSLYKETLICVDMGNKVGNKRMTTNQGVRRGCSLSTALFNIYLDEMIDEWS
jgi:hypothetical protein